MSFELVVTTKNKKKLQEIKDILSGLDLTVISLGDYPNSPRIIENGRTFKANAAKKALKIGAHLHKLTMGEDSGLCVNALSGRPGVYSSRFSGKNRSDTQNNAKLLRLMQGRTMNSRRAHYTCAVALADGKKLVAVVEGKCFGLIARELKGSHGFGYDPLFLIPRYKKTFAQLGEGVKHKMSHRFLALKQLRKILEKYIEKHKGS
ncbi:MAG: RdgB/HAM1 family non-canonical purine NTP pyrophosphatase [Candidatus Omnitrophica bacterium]|nr:RdgB/HAM1 family non-canonical purine NTP pyrophosphatase [Candidatus Omnitrophota bacterium]